MCVGRDGGGRQGQQGVLGRVRRTREEEEEEKCQGPYGSQTLRAEQSETDKDEDTAEMGCGEKPPR